MCNLCCQIIINQVSAPKPWTCVYVLITEVDSSIACSKLQSGKEDTLWLPNELVVPYDSNSIGEEEPGIIKLVAGFIGSGISQIQKCFSYKVSFIQNKPLPCKEIFDDSNCRLNIADRNGLAFSTELCFSLCTFSYG